MNNNFYDDIFEYNNEYRDNYNNYMDHELGIDNYDNDSWFKNNENNICLTNTNYSINNSNEDSLTNYQNKEKCWNKIIENSEVFLKENNLNHKEKTIHKKIIIKMKNRISAQKSRLRKKEEVINLKLKIGELTKTNNDLLNKIDFLEKENHSLKEELNNFNVVREKNNNKGKFENVLIFLILIICIASNLNFFSNDNVVRSGIPIISSLTEKNIKAKLDIKQICDKYCYQKFNNIRKNKIVFALENKSVKKKIDKFKDSNYFCFKKNFFIDKFKNDNFKKVNIGKNLTLNFFIN